MDLKEAYNTVRITDDEEKSVGKYLGFKHATINFLGDFSVGDYLSLKENRWHMPEDSEDFKVYINDFVNIYSAMYKESKNQKTPIGLLRGTSNSHARCLTKETTRFLSTSQSQEVAERFCKVEDRAIVSIRIEEGVPFLYAENYRDKSSVGEYEYIIAPFCRVDKNELNSGDRSLRYYNVDLSKPVLEEKSDEELSELYENVTTNFSKDIQDMDRYLELFQMSKDIRERYPRTTKEDTKRLKEIEDESFEIGESMSEFSSNLKTLLKGLCKQKELEIDRAMEVIEEDKRIKREQREAEAKENARLEKVNELSSKLSHTPSKSEHLENTIDTTYEKLLSTESMAKQTARNLGVTLSRTMSIATINQKISKIKENLEEIKQKCQSAGITHDSSLEEATQISEKLNPLLDGVTYSIELTRNFPDIVNSHREQVDNDIKRSLYEKVHNVLKSARIQKYTREQEEIASEKVGFFGRIMGKDILKEEKLNNINLKIKLAQTSTPDVKSQYSVRDMLAEIYASSISEFDGQFTPEMAQVFNAIKSTYGNKVAKPFTDEQISNLAMKKITDREKANLPVVQDKKRRFFGKNKAKAEELQIENSRLKIKVEENIYSGNKWSTQDKGADATFIFENQLKGIVSSTKSKEQNRDDLDKTVYLWEQE